MIRRTVLAAMAALLLAMPAQNAFAATGPSGQPTAAEQPFLTAIVADLTTRFPTIRDAERAGYFRYTDEDDTGAISYVDLKWTSEDEKHPSQLWYDARGRLIGADYSVPYTPDPPKNLFGLEPSRWQRFGAHVHYGLAGPGGTTYGSTGAKTMAKAGSSVDHPTPDALVAAGIAKRKSDVRFVFAFPAIWDVSVWLIPNPDGAFADKNPDLKPANPKTSM